MGMSVVWLYSVVIGYRKNGTQLYDANRRWKDGGDFFMTDDTPKKGNVTTDSQDRGWHEEQRLQVFMYRLGDKRKNRE